MKTMMLKGAVRAMNMKEKCRSFGFKRKGGQGMTEYALIIALIAIVVIGILVLVGNQIGAEFTKILNALKK